MPGGIVRPKVICGARTRTGEPCQSPPLAGRTRCRNHQGTVAGPSHPSFRQGLYSRALPQGLSRIYQECAADPELLSARQDVALLQTRIVEVLQGLERGETGALWERLASQVTDLQASVRATVASIEQGDREGLRNALGALRGLARGLEETVQKGAEHASAWTELQSLIEDKTRVQAREWKRLVDMQAVLSANEVLTLVLAVAHSVKRHCPDVQVQQRIVEDIRILLQTHEIERKQPLRAEPS